MMAVMNAAVFRALRKHPKVLSNAQTAANLVTRASLAQVAAALDVDEVIVAGGYANSANAGQTASVAEVWTDTIGGAFTTYGSILDEGTSDPTLVVPR